MKACRLLILTVLFYLTIMRVNALDCPAGQFDNGVVCQDCPTNQFSLDDEQQCHDCIGCVQCDATNGACTQCPLGQEINKHKTCSDCPAGTFSIGVKCQECEANCKHCDSTSGNCLSYYQAGEQPQTFIHQEIETLFQTTDCGSNCDPANCTDGVCSLCLTNYRLIGNKCSATCALQLNCTSCSLANFGTCAACDTGFVLSSDENECVQCSVTGCSKCKSNNTCEICTNGMKPQKGQCFKCSVQNCVACSSTNICSSCANGYYRDSSTNVINDQCVACSDPCKTCDSNGQCLTCQAPYSQVSVASDNKCFLCFDPHCKSCTNSSEGTCTECNDFYTPVNGACRTCDGACSQCAAGDPSTCTGCFQYLFVTFNSSESSCTLCEDAPKCLKCPDSKDTCTECMDGYWVNTTGSCVACPAYCSKCTSNTYCTQLRNPYGYTLLDTGLLYSQTNQSNYPAACDPFCMSCSTTNPWYCTSCQYGFYLSVTNSLSYCKPCTYASMCRTCTSDAPGICLTCFPGSYLNSLGKCIRCNSPCIACKDDNADSCTACDQGYILITSNNTCQSVDSYQDNDNLNPISYCANQQLGTNAAGTQIFICELCEQGFTLTDKGCVPCQSGCQICSAQALNTCIFCKPGYYLNGSNICVTSQSHCAIFVQEENLGCLGCQYGYFLNQDQVCQLYCMHPCATCSPSNPFTCLSCLAGYEMVNGACTTNLTCNDDNSCITCPYGYSIMSSNTDIMINQTCVQCTLGSNCAKCTIADPAECTSCPYKFYLNVTDNKCVSCSEGCYVCISAAMCLYCDYGFVPMQVGGLLGNQVAGLVTCQACTSPCATCAGNPTYCTSCNSGFTLMGSVCQSSFRYSVQVTLNATLTQFETNYFSFLTQIANAAGVNFDDITIISITFSSLLIDMQINSPFAPNSNDANTVQNNINGVLQQGSIASMPIISSSVNTIGNDDDDSGLSKTTIIILATVIPIGVLLIVGIIVIIYCVHKRRKEQEAGMNEWNSAGGNTTGRNIELTTGETKRAYL